MNEGVYKGTIFYTETGYAGEGMRSVTFCLSAEKSFGTFHDVSVDN